MLFYWECFCFSVFNNYFFNNKQLVIVYFVVLFIGGYNPLLLTICCKYWSPVTKDSILVTNYLSNCIIGCYPVILIAAPWQVQQVKGIQSNGLLFYCHSYCR